MAGDAEGEGELAGQVNGDQDDDDSGGEAEVLDDDLFGPPGEVDDGGDDGQLVADDDYVGRLQGEVGTVAARGQAEGDVPGWPCR